MATADSTRPEQWRTIPGWETYEVSDHGRVRSLDRAVHRKDGRFMKVKGRILRSIEDKKYHVVFLHDGERKKRFRIHRLVLLAFVGPCPEGMEVCHWDDDGMNNRLGNLRYDSRSKNGHDRTRNGRDQNAEKTHCTRGHQYCPKNTFPVGKSRGCLSCIRARAYAQRQGGLSAGELQKVSDSYYADITK